MTEQEIKETIIACVDYAAEYEKYPKDILSELYEYIEIWYYNRRIDEDKLDELAEECADKFEMLPLQLNDTQSDYECGYTYNQLKECYKEGYCKAKEE